MSLRLGALLRRGLRDPLLLGSTIGVLAAVIMFRSLATLVLIALPVAVFLFRVLLPHLRELGLIEAIDLDLLFLVTHMWAVSTGRPPRRRLFELGVIVKGYGVYQRILRRIAVLAVDWAYGFTRATRIVANEVRNRYLREFLYRLSEVFRTGEDVSRFLRVEFSTLMRQFIAGYGRAIDLMRVYLGVYTALMSSIAFVVLVVILLALFLGGGTNLIITSTISMLALAGFFAPLAKVLAPEDPLVYTAREALNPWLKRVSRTAYIGAGLAIATGLGVLLLTHDPLLSLAGLAIPLLYPGVTARRFQGFIRRLNSFYQIFVRSFGLTFSLIPNYAKALESILAAEYGVLTPFIRRLYARISNGIDPHVALRNFALETSSMDVVRTVNILADTVDAGGDMAEVGLVLSDLLIRLGDLRIDRSRVARTFEAVVYMMQGLLAAITAAMINVLVIFAHYYQRFLALKLPGGVTAGFVLPITMPSLPLVSAAMAIFLAGLIVINSLVITYASGDIPECSLFHIALLSLVTVAGAKLMAYVSKILVLPLVIPTG